MRRFLMVLALLVPAAWADAAPLVVATRVVEPFVIDKDGTLDGFSIDLWREIAREIGVDTRFVVKPAVEDVLAAVKSGEASFGISAISITAERENAFDFSQPYFESGLQILTPQKHQRQALVAAVIEGVFSSSVLPVLGVMAVIILLPAHLIWLWERRHPDSTLVKKAYFPGIFEACWWAAATLATQADQMPRAALARVVAIIWMFASVIFVAYFTASVTSNLTLQQLHGDINGPEDLPGKAVVTLEGSTSAEYLRDHGIGYSTQKSVPEAVNALLTGGAEALVYDAPAMMYYAAHEGRGRTAVVGPVFRKENYGIIARDGTPLMKAVNRALLKLKEDGTYDRLYQKWFG